MHVVVKTAPVSYQKLRRAKNHNRLYKQDVVREFQEKVRSEARKAGLHLLPEKTPLLVSAYFFLKPTTQESRAKGIRTANFSMSHKDLDNFLKGTMDGLDGNDKVNRLIEDRYITHFEDVCRFMVSDQELQGVLLKIEPATYETACAAFLRDFSGVQAAEPWVRAVESSRGLSPLGS